MEKKKITKVIIGIPLILFFILCFLFISESKEWTSISLYFKKRKANEVIQKIESFKEKKHNYPQKLSDVGYPEPDESGPFFYNYVDSTTYRLWFGWGLGESVTYDSRTKEWDH